MILKFRNNSDPAGYYDQFEIEKDLIELKPRENFVQGEWQGDSYDIQAELWERVLISFSATKFEAEELYRIRRANEIYIDSTRYELIEISDREQLGTTEFRKISIELNEYTSTITNFQNPTTSTDYKITVNSNDYYSSLVPLSETKTERELINWKNDAQVKFVQQKDLVKFRFYCSQSTLETIRANIQTEAVSITNDATTTTAIYIENFEAEIIGNDLYEVNVTICSDESTDIETGNYSLYLYHADSTNVPAGWAAARSTDDQLVYDSKFAFIQGYEKETEDSQRTKEIIKESTVIVDKIKWLSIHADDSDVIKIKKYINLVDFARLVDAENYEAQTGTISIDASGNVTTTTGDFSDLRPGMKIIANSETFTIDTVTDSETMTVTPSPDTALSGETWQAQKQYTVIDADISESKNDAGIWEIEYDAVVNEEIFYYFK